jgi:hypothetical protein
MSIALSIQVAGEDDIYVPVATAAAFSDWEAAALAQNLRWIPLFETVFEIDPRELPTLIAEFEAVRAQFERDRERIIARKAAASTSLIRRALERAASWLLQERPEIQTARMERADFIIEVLSSIDPVKVEAIAVV